MLEISNFRFHIFYEPRDRMPTIGTPRDRTWKVPHDRIVQKSLGRTFRFWGCQQQLLLQELEAGSLNPGSGILGHGLCVCVRNSNTPHTTNVHFHFP